VRTTASSSFGQLDSSISLCARAHQQSVYFPGNCIGLLLSSTILQGGDKHLFCISTVLTDECGCLVLGARRRESQRPKSLIKAEVVRKFNAIASGKCWENPTAGDRAGQDTVLERDPPGRIVEVPVQRHCHAAMVQIYRHSEDVSNFEGTCHAKHAVLPPALKGQCIV
jgi:hypothetical protein